MGILGGSFNPPHLGHLVCAQEARWQLGLDVVMLMPVGRAPHKQTPGDPGGETRLELCHLAAAGDDGLEVSRLEVDRPGPSFTVDTLRQMREIRPDAELTFIVGGDMARTLPTWREPETVLQLARLAGAERASTSREGVDDRVVFFDMPRIDISSSLVRGRVGRGEPIRHLVPDSVAECIGRRGLYRGEGATA